MPARQSTLSGGSSPFSIANLGFTAFRTSGGTDPFVQAQQDAAENTYAVSVRYGNGQATIEEYQAAIAAELALWQKQAGSADPVAADAADKKVIELQNLQRDAQNRADEVKANAIGPDALLAQYQKELGTMDPNSTTAIALQKTITDLQKSISDKQQAEQQQLAAFNLATVTAAYNQGAASSDDYLAAYKTYAGSLKPGTAEYVNAQDNIVDFTYRSARQKIVDAVDHGTATNDDLLAFDKQHIAGLQPGSKGYEDAFTALESSEQAKYTQDENAVVKAYNASQMTATAALAFYQKQLGAYSDNPALLATIQNRVNDFTVRIQSDKDSAATQAFSDGTMTAADYSAYAKARQSTVAPGTPDFTKWGKEIERANDSGTESSLTARYTLSQRYDALEKFIGDHSAGAAGARTTTTQVYVGNGVWKTVTSPAAPTAAEQAAWAKTQVAVADAKQQLVGLTAQIQATGGYVSPAAMVTFYQGLQAGVVKGTTLWWTYQNAIDGYVSKQHADAVLGQQGVKVGYAGQDVAGTPITGGTGGKAPGSAAGASVGAAAYTGPAVAIPKGALAPPAGARFGGIAGGGYSAAELDYVANRMAQLTGLSPVATRLWVLKEEGGGNNPLGVSGIGSAGHSGIRANFATIDEGIAAAAQWVNTHGNMAGIKNSVGMSPQAQIDAIDRSPWGPGGGRGGYNGSLIALANQQGYKIPGPTGTVPGQTAPYTGGGATGGGHATGSTGTSAKPGLFTVPPNMDAAQFQKLYSAATAAYRGGRTSFVDPNTQRVYSLPATAQGRLDMMNGLDDLNINLATERLKAAQGTGDPAFLDPVSGSVTTRSAQLRDAVASSATNQMYLLSEATKGATGAPSTNKPGTATRLATGAGGGVADALNPQYNTTSLTPLANGQRLTDQLVASIKVQGDAMKSELAAGHFTAAYAHYTQIIAMTSQSGGIVGQLQAYGKTADQAIAKIQAKSPVGLVGTNAGDITAMVDAAGKIAAAAKPYADLYKTEIAPFVVTDARGNVVPDKSGATGAPGSVALRPGVVLYADRTSDGTLKITPTDIGARVGGIAGKDPTRVQTSIPDGKGGFIQVYATYTVQQIGTITDKNGTHWPLIGKVEGLSAPGQAWVQDPTTGRWVQGPINISAPNMTAKPAIDANGIAMVDAEGQPVYQFDIAAAAGATDASGNPIGGQTFTLKADPKTGVYTLVTTSPDGKSLVSPGTLEAGWSKALGVQVDTSSMTPEQHAQWMTPGNTMAWPGSDAATMQLAINGMTATEQNKRMLTNAITGITSGITAAFRALTGAGQPSLPASTGQGAAAQSFGVESSTGLLPAPPPSPWANVYSRDDRVPPGDQSQWYGAAAPAPLAPPMAAPAPIYQPAFLGGPTPGPAPIPPAMATFDQGPVATVTPPPLIPMAGQGAGSTGLAGGNVQATIGLPGKAPVVKNPSSTASATIGVGAAASGAKAPTVPGQPVQHQQLPGGGVQGTASLPPPIKAPPPPPINRVGQTPQ